MSVPDLLSIFLIAISLSADCFAVALGGSISIKNLRYIQIFRTALVFGAAQAFMPLAGWLLGHTVIDYIADYDHWVVFGLLSIVGGKMIWEAFHEQDERTKEADISRGILLVTLAIATSIDALAVGLSFAFMQINILLSSLIIGIVAFLLTASGFYFGQKAGEFLGQRIRIFGGIILIGIGIRALLSHLLI
jgi:putative Mn2+ efflux pump MntP